MVDPTQGQGQRAVKRRHSWGGVAHERGTRQVAAQWSEARYWERCYHELAGANQPPAERYWPVRENPPSHLGYSVPIRPGGEPKPTLEIPFKFYQPPTREDVAAPFVLETADGVKVPNSALLPYTLPEELVPMREHKVLECSLHITSTFTRVVYRAELSYEELNVEEESVEKHYQQIRCATISTRDLNSCLACIRTDHLQALFITGNSGYRRQVEIKRYLAFKPIVCQTERLCAAVAVSYFVRLSTNQVYTIVDVTQENKGLPTSPDAPDELNAGFRFAYPAQQTTDFPLIHIHIGADITAFLLKQDGTITELESIPLKDDSYLPRALIRTGCQDLDDLLDLCERCHGLDVYKMLDKLVTMNASGRRIENFDELLSFALDDNSAAGPSTDQPQVDNRNRIAVTFLQRILEKAARLGGKHAVDAQCNHVYVTGLFQRSRPRVANMLTYLFDFYTDCKIRPRFLRPDRYLAAFGALCLGMNAQWIESPLRENYACSSLPERPFGLQRLLVFDLDIGKVAPCPKLLNPDSYIPDRDDLLAFPEKREKALESTFVRVSELAQAILTMKLMKMEIVASLNAAVRRCRQLIQYLKTYPAAFGRLSSRVLIEIRDQCFFHAGIVNPFVTDKLKWFDRAKLDYLRHLVTYDAIPGRSDKYRRICEFLRLVNVFDVGEVDMLDDINGAFKSLYPVFYNSEPLEGGRVIGGGNMYFLAHIGNPFMSYENVVIFLDNHGYDLLLGILPLARQLLQDDSLTRVMLVASNRPTISCISYDQLNEAIRNIITYDVILFRAHVRGRLLIASSGQSSACLDLLKLNREVAEFMNDCDLIVLSGMSKAIHTNYIQPDPFDSSFPLGVTAQRAEFACDIILSAVIKSDYVAETLEAELFDYVFHFQTGPETRERYVRLRAQYRIAGLAGDVPLPPPINRQDEANQREAARQERRRAWGQEPSELDVAEQIQVEPVVEILGEAAGQILGEAGGQILGEAAGQILGEAGGQIPGEAAGQILGEAAGERDILVELARVLAIAQELRDQPQGGFENILRVQDEEPDESDESDESGHGSGEEEADDEDADDEEADEEEPDQESDQGSDQGFGEGLGDENDQLANQ